MCWRVCHNAASHHPSQSSTPVTNALREFELQQQSHDHGPAFPLALEPATDNASAAALCTELSTDRDTLFERLMQHGAILIRGYAVNEPEQFAEVVDALDLENMPYIGGAAVRQKVAGGKVLTANEAPPSEPIPFHHEMAQVPNPPAYLAFCCDVVPVEGGETPIILSHAVYDFAVARYPGFMARVEELGVRYLRILPEEDDPASAIGRSWKSTYQTESRDEAEARMREQGTEWEWLATGDLKTVTKTLPAIRIEPRTGKKTFFNAMIAAYLGWVDVRNDPTRAVMLGDGSPVEHQAMMGIADYMERTKVAIPWQKGDVLLVDNGLTMHSRNPFTPPRRILASVAKGRRGQ